MTRMTRLAFACLAAAAACQAAIGAETSDARAAGVSGPSTIAAAACTTAAWRSEQEAFYKIFVRSFADSNGDRIGDFAGIEQRLPYLQSLGVTSLLLTPIVASDFYHNYFASRFDDVDPGYGDLATFRHMVRAAHKRGMKVYLDQEIQYVPEKHPWWAESAGQPQSRYSRYILYNRPGNRDAESGFLGTQRLRTYDGKDIRLAVLNLHEPVVRSYFASMLRGWLAPHGDADFSEGVDGLRIDHMMDDLDNLGRLTDLVAGFWAPLLAQARAVNPAITVIAEQADWSSYGEDLQARGGIDLVYAFPLRKAMAALDRAGIAAALAATQARTAPGKGQLLFVENHDTNRFASEVGGDARKERMGAALVTLLKGSPMLYYGEELGMQGRQLHLADMPDGNDIPVREAFRWTRTVAGPGSAIWYRDTGPWWSERYARDHDGISVEEQARDPNSLLAFYKQLLALRRGRAELRAGSQCVLDAGAPTVLAVQRGVAPSASLLLMNFSSQPVQLALPVTGWRSWAEGARPRVLLTSGAQLVSGRSGDSAQLGPHSVLLLAAQP